jgi:hypothetical protein
VASKYVPFTGTSEDAWTLRNAGALYIQYSEGLEYLHCDTCYRDLHEEYMTVNQGCYFILVED